MIESVALITNLRKNPESAKLYKGIQKELGFLFKAGFHLFRCEDDKSFPYCAVVLQRESCQILFAIDRGDLFCAFGFASVLGTLNSQDMVYLFDIVNFIEQNPFEQYRTDFLDDKHDSNTKNRIEWALENYAAALNPRLDQILEMFSDRENRWQSFNEYMAELRRHTAARDFNTWISHSTQSSPKVLEESFSGLTFLKLLILVFVLLVVSAFILVVLTTYRFSWI